MAVILQKTFSNAFYQDLISSWFYWLKMYGCHFANNIFKCILLNQNAWILINVSQNFVPKGPINNIPALVQIMAWRRPGNKPLSGPMMIISLMQICVTQPQWVNLSNRADRGVINTVWKGKDLNRQDVWPWRVKTFFEKLEDSVEKISYHAEQNNTFHQKVNI